MREYPRFLNHFIEAFWGRLKPKMATGKKKLTVLCLRLTGFDVSTHIYVFHVFSRSFVGCCPDAAHPLRKKQEYPISEGWRLSHQNNTSLHKFTAKTTSRQNWNKFYLFQISLRSDDMWHFVIMLLAVRWHWKSNHRTELDGKKCSEDIQKTSGSQNCWGRHQHVLGAFNQTEKY